MPGLQGENVAAPVSPVKKSKLSLKFFHKKEAKRALDFSEPPVDEPKTVETEELTTSSFDKVSGPSPGCPTSPGSVRRDALVPFVGLNNLGNTCYLNSILQVLYYCPGLREGIQKLYNMSQKKEKPEEESAKSEQYSSEHAEAPAEAPVETLEEAPVETPAEAPVETLEEAPAAHMELLGSFNSLIASVEQLQSSFLLHPDKYSDRELATPPRKILHTLRKLNPMYEGYLQHDAQEVLQCILGYIQDACDTIRKEGEEPSALTHPGGCTGEVPGPPREGEVKAETEDGQEEEDGQLSGKRKSDTEAGNAKKKPKPARSKRKPDAGSSRPFTRSKRKSCSDAVAGAAPDEGEEVKEQGREGGEEQAKVAGKEEEEEAAGKGDASKGAEAKRKKRPRLGWLRPSGKQPSIFSKFCSMGRLSSSKSQARPEEQNPSQAPGGAAERPTGATQDGAHHDHQDRQSQEGLDLLERLFQGRLVLRTRCLECESYTERREDFQDISVPVQEDQPSSPDDISGVSPDPKPEQKTLNWAISQFASVERIVGEDKYFCETCHHYTEAERCLLFDKTPEVVTIHLKCFSANGLELDPYAGLSKVNTPLQTPLTLSLEEWCTRPSPAEGRFYQLFAVVMHSGVTISSGHYTTYVRMSGLQRTRLWPQGGETGDEEEEKGCGPGGQPKEEALDYDDGEVSFSLKGRERNRREASNAGGKKASEGGVGLLGGQRSVSSYDLGNSNKQTEKPGSGEATAIKSEGSKRRATTGGPEGSLKEADAGEAASRVREEEEAAEKRALGSLLEFEGKWLLFDDSEVRLFQEEAFLRACSPETCSTSTPYLLFYRRTPEPRC